MCYSFNRRRERGSARRLKYLGAAFEFTSAAPWTRHSALQTAAAGQGRPHAGRHPGPPPPPLPRCHRTSASQRGQGRLPAQPLPAAAALRGGPLHRHAARARRREPRHPSPMLRARPWRQHQQQRKRQETEKRRGKLGQPVAAAHTRGRCPRTGRSRLGDTAGRKQKYNAILRRFSRHSSSPPIVQRTSVCEDRERPRVAAVRKAAGFGCVEARGAGGGGGGNG